MGIQKLAWLAFQGSIVVIWCVVEAMYAADTGQEPRVGLAIGVGMLCAYALTLFVSVFLDAGRILRGKITGIPAAPKRPRYAEVAPPRRSFGSPW